MNRRFASVIAVSLAVATGPLVFAQVRQPAPGVEILVGGAPQRRYSHDGRWYVEALKGREYAIRLRNPYGVRVAVALSVDGLNTIDARHTTAANARKWVLDPYETVTISGWQTSQTEARRFEFTTEARSYGQALGTTADLGIISAVFFRERPVAIVSEESRDAPSRQAVPAAPAPRSDVAGEAGSAAARKKEDAEYAATGMGRRTDHAVTQVWLDLEDAPSYSVNIRYEFRPQLVKLGIVPATPVADPLDRRERARGFEPRFAPEVPLPR